MRVEQDLLKRYFSDYWPLPSLQHLASSCERPQRLPTSCSVRHVVFLAKATILSAICLPVHAQFPAPSYDEVFPAAFIHQGTPAKTQVECESTPNAVWITAQWRNSDPGLNGQNIESLSECIRYYPSESAIGANTAIFFFSGDVVLDRDVNDSVTNPGYGNNSYSLQMSMSNRQAGVLGVPYIHVARPGMYGSTGNTAIFRHSKREAATILEAVNAIKAKFGYSRISIVGQSGGGGLVGSLLTSGRTDLDCVAIASGTVSLKTRLRTSKATSNVRPGRDTTGLPYDQLYDSLDLLSNVKADPRRRVFVLADPDDEAVSYISQKEFADKANALGVPVVLVQEKGKGKQHHGLASRGLEMAANCVKELN